MKKKLKATSGKRRGRPPVIKSSAERILSNGLLQRQWKRIKDDVAAGSGGTPTEKLRNIVDWYYAQLDAETINVKLEDAARQDRVAVEAREKLKK